MFALLCAIACLRSVQAAAPPPPLPERIDLLVGETRVLAVKPTRIAVGRGGIVSVSMAGAEQLLLIGEAPGATVIHLWLADGRSHRAQVSVSAIDLAATLRSVEELLQGMQGLRARISAHRILIEGDNADARARERAASVAALYPNLVLNFVGQLGWETTVSMDVRIVEFRHNRLRDLGIRWSSDANGPNAAIIADFVTNELFRPTVPGGAVPGTPPLGPGDRVWPPRGYLGITTTLDSRLRLLEQAGQAAVLAEPMLSCRSGGSARFVSGGEIPLPVTNGLGSTDVQFKEYGVILEVRPVADSSGAIYARVETEISQIDEAQRVLGIPGLLKRRSATDISLRDGETLVIAGLTMRSSSSDVSRVPGLGRLPAAGRLFSARQRRNESTELAIFLTPRIVQPRAPLADGGDRSGERLDWGEARARELRERAPVRP